MKFAHFAIRFCTLLEQNKNKSHELFLAHLNDGTLAVSNEKGFFKFNPQTLTNENEIDRTIRDAWNEFAQADKTFMVPLDKIIHLLNNGEETNYRGLIHFSQDELKMELQNLSVENMGALIGMALMQVWGSKVLHLDQDLISEIRNGNAKPLLILKKPGSEILQDGHETLRCLMAVKACHPTDFNIHYGRGIPVRYLEFGKDIITEDESDVNIGINKEELQPA